MVLKDSLIDCLLIKESLHRSIDPDLGFRPGNRLPWITAGGGVCLFSIVLNIDEKDLVVNLASLPMLGYGFFMHFMRFGTAVEHDHRRSSRNIRAGTRATMRPSVIAPTAVFDLPAITQDPLWI